MSEDREVKVKTTVSKEGDTGALEETATALDAADAAAKKAADSFVALGEAMLSGDATRIKDSVAAARAEIEQWGPLVKEKFGEASAEAKQLADWLEKIKVVEAGLADPLVGSVQDADAALKRLEETAQGSFRSAGQAAAQLRVQIDEAKRAIEEASAAGRDVSEATSAVQRLEQGYSSATEKIGRFNAAQSDAKRDIAATTAEAGGQVRGFHSIEGALDQLGGKYTATAIKGLAVVEAFKQGWEWGTKLREGLNELTDGGFDELLQKLPQVELAVAVFGPKMQTAAQSAGLLANQLNILRKNGIDPTGLSAEQVQAKVDELGKKLQKTGSDASEADTAFRKWISGLGLSREELDKVSTALATNIQKFVAANGQLSSSQFASIFKQQLQSLLDDYAKLGQQAPAEILKLTTAWNVSTSATEQAAARHKQIVDQMVQQLTGAAQRTKQEWTALSSDINAALQGIDFGKLRLDDRDQFEKAKAQIQSWVEEYRKAGQLIPESLAVAAAGVGVTVSALEQVNGAMLSFPAHAESAARSISIVGKAAQEAGPPVELAGKAIEHVSEAASEGQMTLDELKAKYGPVGQEAEVAGEKISKFDDVLGGASSSAKAAGEAAGEAAPKIDSAAAAAKGLGEGQDAVGKTAAEAAKGVKDIGENAKEAAQGDAIPKLQSGLDQLGKSTFADELKGKFEQIGSAAGAAADAVVAALARIDAAADNTLQKLQALTSVEAGAGAAPADSGGGGFD